MMEMVSASMVSDVVSSENFTGTASIACVVGVLQGGLLYVRERLVIVLGLPHDDVDSCTWPTADWPGEAV